MKHEKLSTFLQSIFPILLMFMSGCASQIGTTSTATLDKNEKNLPDYNFNRSPDSVRPGCFAGPFMGIVRNKGSKYPVKDARIDFYYYFTLNGQYLESRRKTTITDQNGKYNIPRLQDYPIWRPGLKLASVEIVISKKNYQTWVFTNSNKNLYQYNNLVMLEPQNFSDGFNKKLISNQEIILNLQKTSGNFYQADSELDNLEPERLNTSGLLIPEKVQKLLKQNSLPLLKKLNIQLEQGGYSLTFDDGTFVSWYVWDGLEWNIKNRLGSYLKSLESVQMKKDFLSQYKVWFGQDDRLRIALIKVNNQGRLLTLGCSKKLCDPKDMISLLKMVLERIDVIIYM
ncbi:MAG: hypothetical protein PF689_02635 [Deltaproteobacteria bacterium]|jgi:hypothetical protein|nr:hypothetical protein [Deltaproteobacteria bacterium]